MSGRDAWRLATSDGNEFWETKFCTLVGGTHLLALPYGMVAWLLLVMEIREKFHQFLSLPGNFHLKWRGLVTCPHHQRSAIFPFPCFSFSPSFSCLLPGNEAFFRILSVREEAQGIGKSFLMYN